MKNIDRKKLLGVLFLILFFIVYILIGYFFSDKGKKLIADSNSQYLMIGDYLLWQKAGNKWEQLSNVPDKFLDYKFDYYYGTSIHKNTIIQNSNNNFYYFDDDYNEYLNDDFRGISRNVKISFPDYQIISSDLNDVNYIASALNNNDYGDDYYTFKINLDFDNDGYIETVYVTSNYSFDSSKKSYQSLFYIVKNNKIEQVIEKVNNSFSFVSVLDIDDDSQYEIIMDYGVKNLRSFDSCYVLYDFVDGKWQKIKGC